MVFFNIFFLVKLSLQQPGGTVLRGTGQISCKLTLCWNFFLMFFSLLDLSYGFLEAMPQRKSTLLITSYQRHILSTWLNTVCVHLDCPTEVVFFKILLCQLALFILFPYYILWNQVTTFSSHLKSKALFHFLIVEYTQNVFEILLHGWFTYSLFIYLFNHLFI